MLGKEGSPTEGCNAMNGIVTLNGNPEPFDGERVQAFIVDVAKIWEGLLDLDLVKARWELDDRAWTALADNARLVRAVKEEMTRRTFNDSAAKERAQLACKGAPQMLENILTDSNAPARNRIEASKELRAYAHAGKDESAADKERFTIIIDLSAGGGERLVFDQPIAPIGGDPPTIDVSDDKETGNE